MDTITQAVLGATVGQAACGRKLGRAAAWWGALAGMLPDFDTFVAAPFGPWATLVAHRGTSHSLWFGPVVGPLLGLLVWRGYRHTFRRCHGEERIDSLGRPELRSAWMLLFVLGLFTHPLLDVFTSYGTQLLAPFSRHRFVLEGVGIIDPFYTLPLVAALAFGSRRRQHPEVASRAAWLALTLTTTYLLVGVGLNRHAEARARDQLLDGGFADVTVTAYSQVLQPLLRRVVARTPDQLLVGFTSPLAPGPIHFDSFPLTDNPAVEALRQSERGRLFEWFALGQTFGYVTGAGADRMVALDDVRYGTPERRDRGLWGIRAPVDTSNHLWGPPERFRHSRGELSAALRALFPAALGRETNLYRVGEE